MAATSGAIRAGRAFVEIFGDDSLLDRTLAGVKTKLRNFGASVSAAGGALLGAGAGIVTPLVGAAVAFAKAGAELDDAANRTGVSSNALQELAFAAEQSGASLSDVEAGFRGLAKFSKQAADGGKAAKQTLGELGLTAADLAGLSPDQRMQALAGALAKVEDPGRKAALAMQIFGRGGSALLPLLNEGPAGLAALTEKFHELGLGMSDESVKAAALLDDELGALWSQFKQIGITIGSAVAPMLLQIVTYTQQVVATVIEFVRANSGLISTIFLVGAGLAGVGALLVGLGGAFVGLSVAAGTVATLLSGIAAAIGFLVSPVGLAIAALAGLTTWFFTSTEAGGQAIDTLTGGFSTLAGVATDSFNAIKNALASGDFAAAANVLWSSLQLAWATGVAALSNLWNDFAVGMRSVWIDTVSLIQGTWIEAQRNIAKGVAWVMSLVDGSDFADVSATIDQDANRQMDSLQSARTQDQSDLQTKAAADLAAAQAGLKAAIGQWESAIVTATTAAPKTAVAGSGAALPADPLATGSAAVASMGTFSAQAGRALAGPDSKLVSAIQQSNDLLQRIVDNTTETEG